MSSDEALAFVLFVLKERKKYRRKYLKTTRLAPAKEATRERHFVVNSQTSRRLARARKRIFGA